MGCLLLMRQLLLLVWKNFVLQIRRPIGTFFELLLPSLALVAIVGLRQIPGASDLFRTCPVSFQSAELVAPELVAPDNPAFLLAYYSPKNNITDAVMAGVYQRLPIPSLRIVPDESFTLLTEYANSNKSSKFNHAGVLFNQLEEGEKDIRYTIRFPYEIDWQTREVTDDFTSSFIRQDSPYMVNGFTLLQRALEESIIEHFANNTDRTVPDISLNMRQMPFPPTATDFFLLLLSFGLAVLIIISFLYTAATITKELVIEKESRIRESMLMMGLRQWVLWTSWFIKQLLFMLIWVIAYTILFKYAKVWPKSDGFLIFIFFLLYVISIIAYGFLISVWFNSPRIALFVSFVVFFITYIPSFFLVPPLYGRIPYNGLLTLGLLSNTALTLGLRVISSLEQQQLGLQWDNVSQAISLEDELNMGAVFGMMICDIFLYMIIAWYVDAVKPGTYGVPKPFYFPFLPSYWTGRPLQCERWKSLEEEGTPGWHDPQSHEEEPSDREAGINIQNLTKTYTPGIFSLVKGEKLAVDALNLNMFEGQITALLGHNGAGKTTTISILTGLYTPTAGTAVINGYDIRTNMDQIRHSLGICPQHNVLFDRLTVREHLKLFAILKGMPFGMVGEEVDRMLADLQFQDKMNTIAQNLSGGMKRKLSVSIALIGGSKTVVLDEPTSGMDPYARRATWDLLAKHKEGRTILLTTHFMDEADLLGDRIAIMAEGRLMCSGSSLFLKSRYGVGYHLTLVKGPSCDTGRLSELVRSTVPGSQLASDVSAELTFLLPFTSSQHFPSLLDTLENEREGLGISSYGVSQTTMEEVFLKVGTGSADDFFHSDVHQKLTAPPSTAQRVPMASPGEDGSGIELVEIPGDQGTITTQPTTNNYRRNTGPALWLQQFLAMFLKRVYNSLRYYIAVVTQLVLPLIFIILALLIVKIPSNTPRDDPRRVLTLRHSSLSDTAEVFLAQFTDVPQAFSFDNIISSDIHATSLDNITEDIDSIISNVREQNFTSTQDCCSYELQLLDKFCAAQDLRELRKCGGDFAYRYCQRCLSCDDADEPGLAVSTSSFSECPTPPELAVEEYPQPHEPLNSRNNFVAEHLLRQARRLERSVFFRRVQAGFVFTTGEPAGSSCSFSAVGSRDSGSGEKVEDKYSGTPSKFYSEDDLSNLTVTIWYNNQALHTVAAALNAYHNVLLKNVMSDNEWSITVYNHPLPRRPDTEAEEVFISSFVGLSISIVATFGFTFFLSSFVIFPITEKESKAKHLQFVSGVNPVIYWLANYAWDLINAAIIVIFSFIIFAAFQVDGYMGRYLGALFWILAFTCFATIPAAYIFSFIFQSHLIAYAAFYVIYYIPSVILQLTVLLYPAGNDKQEMTRNIIHYVSLLHPGYGLQTGLVNIYISGALSNFCDKKENAQASECDSYLYDMYQFHYPGIGAILMYMAIEGVAIMGLIILIEYSFFIPLVRRLVLHLTSNKNEVLPQTPAPQAVDDDVRAEAERVIGEAAEASDNNVVVIKNLTKVYLPHLTGCSVVPPKAAVNNICLAIPRGEFFGFVGVNGAGKTSTFSILTGERSPTHGTAYVAGYDVRTDLKKVQQQIGYCPQFDALIERMTGRELLTMFARLRGIPESLIRDVVTSTINKLDLAKYAKKQCGKYSGGNKRKLSTAIALIGDPPILFLDEPTTGMDPGTRRYLWDVLTGVTREGRSIILTTHSMEECEALCTRLTIMVNGEFKCLGSIQHLKSKFSDGYTLQAKVNYNAGPSSAVPAPAAAATQQPGPAPLSPTQPGPAPLSPTQIGPTPSSPIPASPAPSSPTQIGPGPSSPIQPAPIPASPARPSNPPAYSELFSVPSPEGDALVYNMKVFIEQSFPNSLLAEEHQGSVTYQLPSAGLTWSSVFRQLEANKDRLGIIDYSVSQTTLDQVFINFAKVQQCSRL